MRSVGPEKQNIKLKWPKRENISIQYSLSSIKLLGFWTKCSGF